MADEHVTVNDIAVITEAHTRNVQLTTRSVRGVRVSNS